MGAIDINRLVLVLGVVMIACIAAASNYRVEISGGTVKFEKNIEQTDSQVFSPSVYGEKVTQ